MRSSGRRATAHLRRVVLTAAMMLVAACGDDDGDDTAAPEELCAAVQAWSDASVDAVDAFRDASRELEPDARRARYAEAFADENEQRDVFAEYLADLDLPPAVAERLDEALAAVTQTFEDGAAEAAALPDEAYTVRSVREGSLVTGVEKAKAIVYQALNELADDPATGISRGCGRRGALDLSPAATYP